MPTRPQRRCASAALSRICQVLAITFPRGRATFPSRLKRRSFPNPAMPGARSSGIGNNTIWCPATESTGGWRPSTPASGSRLSHGIPMRVISACLISRRWKVFPWKLPTKSKDMAVVHGRTLMATVMWMASSVAVRACACGSTWGTAISSCRPFRPTSEVLDATSGAMSMATVAWTCWFPPSPTESITAGAFSAT